MSDPLSGYHVGCQDDPEPEDPVAGYTPDWRNQAAGRLLERTPRFVPRGRGLGGLVPQSKVLVGDRDVDPRAGNGRPEAAPARSGRGRVSV